MKKVIIILLIILISLILCLGLLLSPILSATAQVDAVWPEISTVQIAGSFESPVHIASAGDGSGRLFVVEQRGRIRILSVLPITTPLLDITDRVRSPYSGGGGEEGLLSVAFPPDFAAKRYFYVYYTNLDGNNVVSRFHLTESPNLAEPGCEEQILIFDHPNHTNHNGGQLAFGRDSYLYIGTGDGGGAGDPGENAQNKEALLGKLLRIDVELTVTPPYPPDGSWSAKLPVILKECGGATTGRYEIPFENPFYGLPGHRGEIWALGMRNPWRFSFDRLTGDLYIGDVGQGAYEEVDYQPADSTGGENYGWNIMEGNHCYGDPSCDQIGLTLPVAEYNHQPECSITGGFVYRGLAYTSLQGIYFYGDYCTGKIWGLQWDGNEWLTQLLADTDLEITSFGEAEDGELYIASSDGKISQIIERP